MPERPDWKDIEFWEAPTPAPLPPPPPPSAWERVAWVLLAPLGLLLEIVCWISLKINRC